MIFSSRNGNYKKSMQSFGPGAVLISVPDTIVRPQNPNNTRQSVSSREVLTQIIPQKRAPFSMLSNIQTTTQSCCGGAK